MYKTTSSKKTLYMADAQVVHRCCTSCTTALYTLYSPSGQSVSKWCTDFWNVFVKPKEQSEACFDSALARKGRMKSNVFMKPRVEAMLAWALPRLGKGRMKSNTFLCARTFLFLYFSGIFLWVQPLFLPFICHLSPICHPLNYLIISECDKGDK